MVRDRLLVVCTEEGFEDLEHNVSYLAEFSGGLSSDLVAASLARRLLKNIFQVISTRGYTAFPCYG